MDEDAEQDVVSVTMTVAIHGVLREPPWITQVAADHDLAEDLLSPVVKRAAAYGFSSTRVAAGAELGGQRWGYAGAGGGWSQDGQVRQLGRLTVYPATGLREQHLPVLPMTRVLIDALHRLRHMGFAGLSVSVPVQLAPDTGFDLVGEADWYALAAPDGRTRVLATVTVRDDVAEQVGELASQKGHGLLQVQRTPQSDRRPPAPGHGVGHDGGGAVRSVFVCDVLEWTPDAASWLTEVFIDSLRAAGVQEEVGGSVLGRACGA